jgi:hypothetical protein
MCGWSNRLRDTEVPSHADPEPVSRHGGFVLLWFAYKTPCTAAM